MARTIPSGGGTAGEFSEYRIWDRARSAAEIRAAFDQSFSDEPRPAGLTHWFGGTNWSSLHGGARVERADDFPRLLTAAESREQEEKFAKFRLLIAHTGDSARGQDYVQQRINNQGKRRHWVHLKKRRAGGQLPPAIQ